MRHHIENALWGTLDYAVYPVSMLLMAPILLRALGPAQFGIWAFASAAGNTGAILASGFGDANIQHVALARSTRNSGRVEQCIRTTVAVHLLLGFFIAGAMCIAAPVIAERVANGTADVHQCVACLRIAAGTIPLRAIETVIVSTQRAFERYSEAVRISASVRVFSLGVSAGLAVLGWNSQQILAAAAVLMALGTLAQCVRLCNLVTARSLVPLLDPEAGKSLIKVGSLTWLQSAAAVIFGQVDRLVVGVVYGSVTVGAYTLCVQMAQPIAGITASALHFVFPYLARTTETGGLQGLRVKVAKVLICNLLLVSVEAGVLLRFGGRLIRIWAPSVALHMPPSVLPVAVLASALVGLSVTGTYAMLAIGRAGAVVWMTLASGAAMLCSVGWLWRHFGVTGVAASRVLFGLVSLGIYIHVARLLNKRAALSQSLALLHVAAAKEGL